jgi:hypothetical protein
MFCRSITPLRRTIVVGAMFLVATATAAGAQQVQPSRFARPSLPAASGGGPLAPSRALVPADSAARYLRIGRAQQQTGGSLVGLGLVTVAGAYVGFMRSGRMGMSGGQAATLGAGAVVGALGATRWAASRESLAAAARWQEEARVAAAP